MRHCVGSYWKRCRSLRSALFSARSCHLDAGVRRMRRHFTIEVLRESGRIIQVRGKNNRYIRVQDVPELVAWADQNGLKRP